MRKFLTIDADLHERLVKLVEKIKRIKSYSQKRLAEDAIEREIKRLEKKYEVDNG